MANPIPNELDLNNLEENDFTEQEKEVKEVEETAKEVKTQEPEAKEDDNKSEEVKKEEESAKEEEKPDIEALIATLEKEVENTNKRYDASSVEGKRLYKENQELQEKLSGFDEVKPVLDILANNPELQEIAKGMIAGTYQGDIPDETLDFDDAIRNPNSTSGKILAKLVERKANALNTNATTSAQPDNKTAREDALNSEIERVSKEQNLTNDQVSEILDFGKNVSFKDVVTLYNLEKGNGNGQQTDMLKLLDQIKQLNKTSGMEKNVKGAKNVEMSAEDKVANAILGAGGHDLNDLIPT